MAKNYKVVFDEVVTLPGVGIDVNSDFGKIGTGYKDGDEVKINPLNTWDLTKIHAADTYADVDTDVADAYYQEAVNTISKHIYSAVGANLYDKFDKNVPKLRVGETGVEEQVLSAMTNLMNGEENWVIEGADNLDFSKTTNISIPSRKLATKYKFDTEKELKISTSYIDYYLPTNTPKKDFNFASQTKSPELICRKIGNIQGKSNLDISLYNCEVDSMADSGRYIIHASKPITSIPTSKDNFSKSLYFYPLDDRLDFEGDIDIPSPFSCYFQNGSAVPVRFETLRFNGGRDTYTNFEGDKLYLNQPEYTVTLRSAKIDTVTMGCSYSGSSQTLKIESGSNIREVNNAGQVQIFGYVEDALANTFTSDSSSTCPTFVGYSLSAPPAGATNIRKLSDVVFDGVEFTNVEADWKVSDDNTKAYIEVPFDDFKVDLSAHDSLLKRAESVWGELTVDTGNIYYSGENSRTAYSFDIFKDNGKLKIEFNLSGIGVVDTIKSDIDYFNVPVNFKLGTATLYSKTIKLIPDFKSSFKIRIEEDTPADAE